MGIGLGMMAGVGGTVGGMVGGVVSDAFAGMDTVQPQTMVNKFRDQCGAELTPGAAFCDECELKYRLIPVLNVALNLLNPGNFAPNVEQKGRLMVKMTPL
ncbi:MAG: hypothetical protein V8R40_04040 [Dysosmobacter sp.]